MHKITEQGSTGEKMETNLKAIRIAKKISINECVQKTGIPIQTLLRYERGGTTIAVEHFLTLRDFYQVSLDDFFDKNKQNSQEKMEG